LDIGKAIDKLQGNEREVIGKGSCGYQVSISKTRLEQGYRPNLTKSTSEIEITKGTTAWEGWGTALKPSHEPICVARKPLSEKTVALNVLKYGTGGINIDGCRVGTDDKLVHGGTLKTNSGDDREGKALGMFQNGTPNTFIQHSQGRFPANFIHDGSEDVVKDFPVTQSGSSDGFKGEYTAQVYGKYAHNQIDPNTIYADKGSASRFFQSCPFADEDLPAFIYMAKASKSERDEGCDEIEAQQQDPSRKEGNPGGDNPRNRGVHLRTNNHPTVKPLKLMQYLVRLVTPPGGMVLDPFMGSGTTGVACVKEKFDFIGIEMDAEHMKSCEARINNTEPDKVIPDNQLELF